MQEDYCSCSSRQRCRFEKMVLQTHVIWETLDYIREKDGAPPNRRVFSIISKRFSVPRPIRLLNPCVRGRRVWHLPQKCQHSHYEKHFIIKTFSALLFNWKILWTREQCCHVGDNFIFENVSSWKLIPRQGITSSASFFKSDSFRNFDHLMVFVLIGFISGLKIKPADIE